MNTTAIDPRYLEVFPQWLRSLGEDASAAGDVIARTSAADEGIRSLVAGINYIFKSLDLIPDGVDDLGFMDDAFVLRTACAFAVDSRPDLKEGAIQRLAEDAHAVREFMGETYPRLEAYVADLRKGAARGRTVDDIVTISATREAFLRDVRVWAAGYECPTFTRDAKTLVKLKAFLNAKLL